MAKVTKSEKERIINNYLDRRFQFKDQLQIKENWKKEFQWFLDYVFENILLCESAEPSRNEKVIPMCDCCKQNPATTAKGLCITCDPYW